MNTSTTSQCLPRFSLRTLIVVVTLVCLYFGMWELTNTAGKQAVVEHVETNVSDPSEMTCQAPFLVSSYWYQPQGIASSYPQGPERRHFVWMIGPVVPLPQGFTRFVERMESIWYAWTQENHMTPQRVHGGVI